MSGTSPDALLDRPLVEQVAGDSIAGFYQPRLEAERTDDAPSVFAPKRPDAPLLEGYNWGGLTSGSPGRAFWLLLLPFTLANIAPRMRPSGTTAESGLTRAIWYLTRLLALSLTALLVLATAGIGEDLFGWQCLETDRCSKASPRWILAKPLGKWTTISGHTDGWRLPQVLVLGAAVPTLVLFALWFVSKRTIDRYESVSPTIRRSAGVPEEDSNKEDSNKTEIGLGSKQMWTNACQVRRLQAVHMQFGFALILWTLIAPTERTWVLSASDPHRWGKWPSIVSLEFRTHWVALIPAAVMIYGVIVLFSRRYTGRDESGVWKWTSHTVFAILAGTGGTEIVAFIVRPHWVHKSYLDAGKPKLGLPGYSSTLLGFFLATILILILLFLVVWVAASKPDPPAHCPTDQLPLARGLRGMSTTVFASMGVFLAAVFSAATYTLVAAWLYTGSLKPGFATVSKIYQVFRIPDVLRYADLAYSFSVGFLLLVLVVTAVRFALEYSVLSFGSGMPPVVGAGAMARDYGSCTDDSARTKSIERDIIVGGLFDRAPAVLAPLVFVGFLLTAFASVVLVAHDMLNETWMDWIARKVVPPNSQPSAVPVIGFVPSRLPGFFTFVSLQGTGAYLAVMTLVALVAVGAAAFKAAPTRRSVGVLWDIASFWPRAAHPLAAPCYAERTVPDLVTRINWYRTTEPPTPLVLAGHSQGSVLSAAAIFHLHTYDDQPGAPILSGVGFLSYGCVLRRIYARYFPVYFGTPQLDALQSILTAPPPAGTKSSSTAMPRWRNLWRYTDYLGGQVTAGPPCTVPPTDAQRVPPDQLPTEPPVYGPVPWEWHSPDPWLYARPPGSTQYVRANRHSSFWEDDSGHFQLGVRVLLDQIAREAP